MEEGFGRTEEDEQNKKDEKAIERTERSDEHHTGTDETNVPALWLFGSPLLLKKWDNCSS